MEQTMTKTDIQHYQEIQEKYAAKTMMEAQERA